MAQNKPLMISAGVGAGVTLVLALVVFALAGMIGNALVFVIIMAVVGALNGLVVGFIRPASIWQQAALGAGVGALLGFIGGGPLQIVFGAVVGYAVCEVLKRVEQQQSSQSSSQ